MAGWWNDDYKHRLREASNSERKKAHDRLLAAGLPLDGASVEHADIIARATNNGRRCAEKMGLPWKPYAKRKVMR
jgi:hypothetical protein